jgi:hypothetical protein
MKNGKTKILKSNRQDGKLDQGPDETPDLQNAGGGPVRSTLRLSLRVVRNLLREAGVEIRLRTVLTAAYTSVWKSSPLLSVVYSRFLRRNGHEKSKG